MPGTMSPKESKPICTYFERTGQCRYGDRCRYQHPTSHNSATAFKERSWSGSEAIPIHGRDGSHVRIMSYNILADLLAHEHADELYKACPQWCLNWKQRGPGIMAEIMYWAPDIGCLQEVDHPDQFQTFLEQHGYETAYASRTGERTDGCLTFWRTQRFVAKAIDTVFMVDHGLKDNVALLVLLEQVAAPQQDWQWGTGAAPGSSGSPQGSKAPALLVGNTHLLFNPKRGDIKTAQIRTMLEAMRAMQQSAGQPSWAMLMGDFNSIPGSAIYRFVKTGKLDCSLEDRRNMSGQLSMDVGRWFGSGPRYERSRSFPERRLAPRLHERGTPQNRTPLGWQASPGSFAGQQTPVTPQEPDQDMTHSSSVPSKLSYVPLSPVQQACRAQSMNATAPQLYSHIGSDGEAFWSPVPPNSACEGGTPPPIYYEPMCVEEPSPEPDLRIARSASRAARMANMATWSKNELATALGTKQDSNWAHELGLLRTQSRPQHMLKHLQSNVDSELERWVVRHCAGTLHSAYREVLGDEPEYSSCHGRVIATLDYMWYSETAHLPSASDDEGMRSPTGDHSILPNIPQHTSSSPAGLANLQNGDSLSPREAQHSSHRQRARQQAIACELPDISEDAELPAAPGSQAFPGGQDSKQAVDDSSLKAKLGAAVRDWKGKHREKSEASASKDTAPQAHLPAALGEGSHSRGWVLRPYRVAQPPPLKSLRCGLPSPKYPSDHISLIADFSMSKQ